jgi:hypothetical protein
LTVAYADVPNADRLAAMGDFLPGSQWLATVGAGYGVGLRGHTHFSIDAGSPTSFTRPELALRIAEGIDAGEWPATWVDAGEPLWVVFYGPTTPGLDHFWGEHFADDRRVLAWIAPADDGGLERYERVFAHEVIEALTDPYSDAWHGQTYESEVGDLCETVQVPDEAGFALPASWSNDASKAGLPPCQPAFGPYGTLWGPSQVSLDPGQSVELDFPAISGTGLSAWNVEVRYLGGSADDTDFELSSTSVSAGAVAHVRLTAYVTATSNTYDSWLLVSTTDGGTQGRTPLTLWVR